MSSRTIYLLKRVEIALRNGLETALAGTGISVAQYAILSLLDSSPDISSAQLARRAGVTPQTISETVSVFERAGYIARVQSQHHKRIRQISMMPPGTNKLAECNVRVDSFESALLRDLDAAELRTLRKSLRTILAVTPEGDTVSTGDPQ